MKQIILCSLFKEFVFSKLLTGENSKNKYLREETSWTYKLIFKQYCICEASLSKQLHEFLKT